MMTVSRKRAVKDRIKDVVRYIWMNDIRVDFESDMLLGGNSLETAFYYYLRKYLRYEIERDDLRIYTGYFVRQASEKADIVIAHMDTDKLRAIKRDKEDIFSTANDALEILCVFKFLHQNYSGGADEFCAIIDTVKENFSVTAELSECDYYLGFISEYYYQRFSWVGSIDSGKYSINELTAVWDEEENGLIWHFY